MRPVTQPSLKPSGFTTDRSRYLLMEVARARVPDPAKPSPPKTPEARHPPAADARRRSPPAAAARGGDSFAATDSAEPKPKILRRPPRQAKPSCSAISRARRICTTRSWTKKKPPWVATRWLVEMRSWPSGETILELFRLLAWQLIRSFRDDAAFHRLLLYASRGHLLADLFHERFGLPLGGPAYPLHCPAAKGEGAFRECDAGAAVMFVFGSTVHATRWAAFSASRVCANRRGNRRSVRGNDSRWPRAVN